MVSLLYTGPDVMNNEDEIPELSFALMWMSCMLCLLNALESSITLHHSLVLIIFCVAYL